MVSQGSFYDSDGVPGYMQDGPEADILEEICARGEVEDFPILVGLSEGLNAKTSSSGGIYVESEKVGDEEASFEGEDPRFEDDRAAIERETINRVATMAYASNKDEREELIALRLEMMEMKELLRKKGISWVEMEEEALKKKDDFNGGLRDNNFSPMDGDEFGLPIFNKTTMKDYSFAKRDKAFIVGQDELELPVFRNSNHEKEASSSGVKGKEKVTGVHRLDDMANPKPPNVFEDMPRPEKRKAGDNVHETTPAPNKNKSWSNIVKEQPHPPVTFEYVPLKEGESVISPPDEELIKGNAKFKNFMVGTFTKFVALFNIVADFAKRMWGAKGLCGVAQKSSSTFLFKFNNEVAMIEALSKGTWYVGKKPMAVTHWGNLGNSEKIKNIPLWVKISNISDSYCTNKGLSRLASVIGPPLCAYQLTSKMEVLSFAKFCVNYDLGSPLPNSVKVVSLNPVTGEKVTSEVQFTYPNKPLMCTCCQSLGHTVGVCPKVIRTWVQKVKHVTESASETCQDKSKKDQEKAPNEDIADVQPEKVNKETMQTESEQTQKDNKSQVEEGTINKEEGWKTIHTKSKEV